MPRRARGRNPQYRHQHLLSAYTNRLSHLLQGGRHIAPFAVLYHADAEWLGEAQPCERPLRLLAEAQLDADIVPADALAGASVSDRGLTVGQETFDALIVPGSAFLPAAIARELLRFDDDGVPVVFVGEVPRVVGDAQLILRERFIAVPEEALVAAVAPLTTRAVRTAQSAPSLRLLRIDQGGADVVMLVNESTATAVRTTATVPRAGDAVAFDALTARLTAVPVRRSGAGTDIDLDLDPGASLVLLVGSSSAWEGADVAPAVRAVDPRVVAPTWSVSTATAEAYPEFEPWAQRESLTSLAAPDLLPRFSGTVRYTASFSSADSSGPQRIDLGAVFELASVRLNGVDLGTRVAPPYVFDAPAGVLTGENTIEIEVVNTLAKAQPDFFSAFAQQDPTGLLGPVTVARLEEVHP